MIELSCTDILLSGNNSNKKMLLTYNAQANLDDISFGDMADSDVGDPYTAAAPLLSDDVWKKFELDGVMNIEDNIYDDLFFSSNFNVYNNITSSSQKKCKIRNHDCMWAGHCGSKEHPADEPRLHIRTIPPVPPVIYRTPSAINKQTVTSGRSLLLRTAIKQQQQQQTQQQIVQVLQHQAIVVSPDSPPMSDDEECKTSTLQILQDVISTCDIEDDSDLCDYFEEEEFLSESVEESKTTQVVKAVHQYARDNDHSYHKDKNASMHLSHLGIETPSDSEEEIDVVSVGDKHTTRGIASTLPNNPTSVDRQQLQKTMATAITNKRLNSTGVKTILPFRKPSVEQSPVKRRATEGRGSTKRTRHQHRLTPNGSPYKKRGGYNHSSDSEAEPSEKRSLHNNMERQRRIDLRNAFEDLRVLVPEVSKKDRAAKVVILREASVYCDALGDMSDKMCRQKDELRREQERLRSRLSQLRRALAAKHR